MKRNLIDFLIVMGWVALLWAVIITADTCRGAEPKAIVSVTTTPSGLVLLDARKSIGKLTWKIRGEHEILFDGQVVVCRGDFVAALVAASPDGTVDVVLLPVGADIPQPATLADKVRKLARDLPADERKLIAEIHSALGAKADDEQIISSKALFQERIAMLAAAFPDGKPKGWAAFFVALNQLLDEVDNHTPLGVDGPASAFAEPFRQVAEGLAP